MMPSEFVTLAKSVSDRLEVRPPEPTATPVNGAKAPVG
jgi:hypothetical protein